MKKLVFEEPIVPVIIDRDQELECYYSSIDSLFQGPSCSGGTFSQGTTPYPPHWQASNPAPHNVGWGAQPAPYSYGEQPYTPQSGYAPYPQGQPSYPGNPQYPGTGYTPPQMPNYQSYQPYDNSGQYPPQQYPPYYVHQPAPYPNPGAQQPRYGYQSYPAYQQAPAVAPGYYPPHPSQYPGVPESITPSKSTTSHASAPPSDSTEDYNSGSKGAGHFEWSEALLGDFGFGTYHNPSPVAAPSPVFAGRSVVNEAISPAQYSTEHVNEYYSQQFERLSIGWNV